MRNNDRKPTFVVNFMDLLQLAFIVLKLCKVITWSWWWVLAPLWGSIALILLISSIVVLVETFKK